ncbi:MAG: hypothetical protein ACTH31_11180, partial [Pseudoclavibacter sp.]
MNATNRGLNRSILFITGAVLLCLGAAAVAAALWPLAAEIWGTAASALSTWMLEADDQTRLASSTTASWLVVAVLALLVLIV